MYRIKTLNDIIKWRLCIGCGACSYYCENNAIKMINIESTGIKPFIDKTKCERCNKCISICPGYSLYSNLRIKNKDFESFYIGPALKVWEGYSKDNDIRFHGSSGGIISSLALYLLEKENMNLVLHTGMNPEVPWENISVMSKNKMDLIRNAGSRYAPSSPCENLQIIEKSPKKCVFIGKPCDAAAISKLRKYRKKLDEKIGAVLTFFCAGTPSTSGTLDLIEKMKINTSEINSVHYRGCGWPGNFRVIYNEGLKESKMTYKDSWGYLSRKKPFRCNLCPDGLGEFADISCGDAWHTYKSNSDEGNSIIIIRTNRGKEIVKKAFEENYIHLTDSSMDKVIAAQSLINRRKQLFGRLLALKLFLIPVPKFKSFYLFKIWLDNSLIIKIKSILGTIKRIIIKKLWISAKNKINQ